MSGSFVHISDLRHGTSRTIGVVAAKPASPGRTSAEPHTTNDMNPEGDGFEISATRLKERLDQGHDLRLIDVREPWEWDLANLEAFGARLIPMATVPQHVQELDPDDEVVVYCRSGARSMRVLRYLQAHGFEKVRNLQGGLLAWSNEVDPTFPQY